MARVLPLVSAQKAEPGTKDWYRALPLAAAQRQSGGQGSGIAGAADGEAIVSEGKAEGAP